MRPLTVLLVLSPLTLATTCPPMLEHVNISSISDVGRIEEAIDVACGRRNFTTAFWSLKFAQELIKEIVNDQLAKDNSTSISFRPLFQSVKDQYKLLDKPDVKQIVDKLFRKYRRYLRRDSNTDRAMAEMAGITALQFGSLLSVDSQISLAQATKKGFGVIEGAEVKQQRIDTAMKAIERFGTHTKNERMADLFPRLYELVKDNWIFRGFPFENFAMDMEKSWNGTTDISHLEIVPAIETLYIQYNALSNSEAKTYVNWCLAWMALLNPGWRRLSGPYSDDILMKAQDVLNGPACPSRNGEVCFEALAEEAKTALKSAFPEFSNYLNSKQNLDTFAYGPSGVAPAAIEQGVEKSENKLIEKMRGKKQLIMEDKETGEIYIFHASANSTWAPF